MPKLTNKTDRPIEAPSGHVIPAEGELTISDKTMHRMANEPYIARRIDAGDIAVRADDPAPAEPELTREFIAKAKRSELLDVILAHYPDNYTEDDFEGVKVEDSEGEDGEKIDGLRTIAARIVFSDL